MMTQTFRLESFTGVFLYFLYVLMMAVNEYTMRVSPPLFLFLARSCLTPQQALHQWKVMIIAKLGFARQPEPVAEPALLDSSVAEALVSR